MKRRYFLLSFLVLLQGSGFIWSQNSDLIMQPISAKFNQTIFGENVFVFDPAMDMNEIQVVLDTIFARQSARRSEFTKNRYALFFKPGKYELDVRVGYYMQILGLGASPEDVVITGAVRSNTRGNSVLVNFWRGVENLNIVPTTDSTVTWGVSQAAPMRRVYIKGNMNLFDKGYASGGFLADSKIDGIVASGPQQQWFTRNTKWGKWTGGNWNMMFMGVINAPVQNFPENPYTTIETVPLIREKPFLAVSGKGLVVKMPRLRVNSSGPGWTDHVNDEAVLKLKKFYIAKPDIDNAATINSALKKGKNILFTPGIYSLDQPVKVTKENTVILGLGMPSLVPLNGHPVMEIADVDGVTISGILLDAGLKRSEVLLQVGEPGSLRSHEANPSFLFDVFVRVGGPHEGSVKSAVVINSKNVVADHTWLWRADHGNGVGWDRNWCANGLVVNGDDVTIYGLFNEHNQEYQTLWNGNGGRVYFYQSEMPYDPPTVDAWKHGGVNGYASYKLADDVKTHEAWGVGIYNVFYQAPVIVDNAIETPAHLEDKIHHKIIFWLNGNKESEVRSIINGKGGPVNQAKRKAAMK
jgi:hypothetical protein